MGGLGIVNPTKSASDAYATSWAATKVIANAMKGESTFNLDSHEVAVNSARSVRKERAKVKDEELFAVLLPKFSQHSRGLF